MHGFRDYGQTAMSENERRLDAPNGSLDWCPICEQHGMCAKQKCYLATPSEKKTPSFPEGWPAPETIKTMPVENQPASATQRKDAERYRKLRKWMSTNVKKGWSEVETLGAISVYAQEDFDAYLDGLPECNVGLCETSKEKS